MERYECSVTETDELVAYVTDIHHLFTDEFALVMTNAQKQKFSVILSPEDARRLHHQLGSFLNLDT